MLRLKRQASDKILITWRERTSPSKRLVGKAFCYSLCIHLVLILVFQIRIYYFEKPATETTPTVLLDTEDSSIAIFTDMRTFDEDPRHRLVQDMHLTNTTLLSNTRAVHGQWEELLNQSTLTCEKKRDFLPILTLPWSFSDPLAPSRHVCRTYPLTITLHQNLRSLHFSDDGARLFRQATMNTLYCTPTFSESKPQVEFKIEVSKVTGKITNSICLGELIDKRLQGLAQHIIKCLRFSPGEATHEPIVSGILTLQFAGTFETISPLLEPGAVP